MPNLAPHILVAGAGIGGLTLAALLAQHGAQVDLFEKTAVLSEAGAGIQLSPNALQVLQHLGIQDQLIAAGVRPEFGAFYDYRTGKTLLRTDMGSVYEARYGQPYLHIHRTDLQAILLDAARNAGATLHLGEALLGYGSTAKTLTAKTTKGTYQADGLIGADGIHSALRKAMIGELPARFTGQVAWRGTIMASQVPGGLIPRAANCWMGPGQHLVAYYLRGGEMINFIAVQERADWHAEDWTIAGNVTELQNAFTGWAEPVRTLLDACEETYLWGLFDRPPLANWTDERAALLGDAAHSMLPFQAQGAAMAIEDAWVAAQCLLTQNDISVALQTYQQARQARTKRVAAISAANGRLFHAASPIRRAIRNTGFAAAMRVPALLRAKLDPIYGYNAPANFPL